MVDMDAFLDKAIETIEKNAAAQVSTEPTAVTKTPPPSDGTAATETVAAESAGEKPVEVKHDWEKRYNALQSDMDRRVNAATQPLKAQLDQVLNLLAKKEQAQPSTPPDEGMTDLSDPSHLARFVEKVASEIVAKSVPQYFANDPIRNTVGMKLAVDDLAYRYSNSNLNDLGYSDFNDYKERIARTMERLPNAPVNAATFEQIYLTLKAADAGATRPVAAEATNSPASTAKTDTGNKISPEEMQRMAAKSQQLATPQGVASGSDPRRIGKLTRDQRIDAAMEEYEASLRGGR